MGSPRPDVMSGLAMTVSEALTIIFSFAIVPFMAANLQEALHQIRSPELVYDLDAKGLAHPVRLDAILTDLKERGGVTIPQSLIFTLNLDFVDWLHVHPKNFKGSGDRVALGFPPGHGDSRPSCATHAIRVLNVADRSDPRESRWAPKEVQVSGVTDSNPKRVVAVSYPIGKPFTEAVISVPSQDQHSPTGTFFLFRPLPTGINGATPAFVSPGMVTNTLSATDGEHTQGLIVRKDPRAGYVFGREISDPRILENVQTEAESRGFFLKEDENTVAVGQDGKFVIILPRQLWPVTNNSFELNLMQKRERGSNRT